MNPQIQSAEKTRPAAPQEGAWLSEAKRRCVKECQDCHSICQETATYCLQQGGRHADAEHITLLLDCAASCQNSADFMLRGSQLDARACAFCAEVCNRCATDCENFSDDAKMKACAEACRRCADTCRQMGTASA